MAKHYVYIVKCKDNSLYTGYTTNVEARIATHNAGKGAKYTKTRRPVVLVYQKCLVQNQKQCEESMKLKHLADNKN